MAKRPGTSTPAHLRTRGSMESGERTLGYPPAPEPLRTGVYDNHAHLEIADGENPMDYLEHLARAEEVGIVGVVQVGTNVETSRWSAEIAATESRILAAVALHPNESPDLSLSGALEDALGVIDELAQQPRVVAIGETGLDYFRTAGDLQEHQRKAFIEHIHLAKRHGVALQIHDRDAHHDVVRILLEQGAPERTVFHCYSGDGQLAEILNAHGWYASFSGTVTFGNAKAVQEGARRIDPSLMLIETDAPFLTPTPFRGAPNGPYMIPYTLRFLAELRGVDENHLALQLTANTHAVYGHWDDHPVGPAQHGH